MKRLKTLFLLTAIVLTAIFALTSCGGGSDPATLWDNATYIEDTELGEGATTIEVEVKVEENSVTFTIHTDATTLGEALLENELVTGEMGAYGLYIKTVNGVLADYDVDASYWASYKNGEYLMSGVDTTNIADGEHYELVYTK